MKKTFAVIAAVLFVLSFAASAFAIHAEIPAETQAIVAKGSTQITIGGEIRVRGWKTLNRGDAAGGIWEVDETDGAYFTDGPKVFGNNFGAKNRTASWYDQRVRLYVDAQVTPNVKGYIMLESENADTERTQWDSGSDKYRWGNFNSHAGDMGIAEAWIQYTGSGLFGFPAGIKVGHMPLKLAEGQFFEHTQLGDDAIVFFMDPTKQVHIGLITVKFSGDTNYGTAYSPILPFGQGNFLTSRPSSAGITGQTFTSCSTSTPYTAFLCATGYSTGGGSLSNSTDDLDGYVALMTYKIDDKHTVGINYTYLKKSDIGFSLQNVGLHGKGNVGNFGYAAEVDFQFGKLFDASKWNNDNDSSWDMPSFDYDGWALLLSANYKMDKFNFRGKFGYGSGDADPFDRSIKTFIPFVGGVQNIALIYEYLTPTTAGGTATGLANTTYYNLGVDYAATKDLSFGLDGFIYRASKTWEDMHISKNAGWEIDGKMRYQIAKNLSYQFDIGYFKPGSFYKDTLEALTMMHYGEPYQSENHYETVKVSNPKGMTVLRHMLTLSF